MHPTYYMGTFADVTWRCGRRDPAGGDLLGGVNRRQFLPDSQIQGHHSIVTGVLECSFLTCMDGWSHCDSTNQEPLNSKSQVADISACEGTGVPCEGVNQQAADTKPHHGPSLPRPITEHLLPRWAMRPRGSCRIGQVARARVGTAGKPPAAPVGLFPPDGGGGGRVRWLR